MWILELQKVLGLFERIAIELATTINSAILKTQTNNYFDYLLYLDSIGLSVVARHPKQHSLF